MQLGLMLASQWDEDHFFRFWFLKTLIFFDPPPRVMEIIAKINKWGLSSVQSLSRVQLFAHSDAGTDPDSDDETRNLHRRIKTHGKPSGAGPGTGSDLLRKYEKNIKSRLLFSLLFVYNGMVRRR